MRDYAAKARRFRERQADRERRRELRRQLRLENQRFNDRLRFDQSTFWEWNWHAAPRSDEKRRTR
jgi:cell shape-determining protein MreC